MAFNGFDKRPSDHGPGLKRPRSKNSFKAIGVCVDSVVSIAGTKL